MSLTLTLKDNGGSEVSGTGSSITLQNTVVTDFTKFDLKGDTTQQTYTGKNLLNIAGAGDTSAWVKNNNGGFTFTKNSSSDRYSPTLDVSIPANTNVTISYDADPNSTAVTMFCQWFCSDNTNLWSPNIDRDNATGTVTTTFSKEIVGVRFYFQDAQANGTYMTIENFQIELGSSKTSYEPYVGGIASPNPDYPQNVNVVSGEQTITISDGNSQSQSYTVDLGSIELCKIGDYQDYIYKSGDDWYVHKEVGKLELGGTTGWWLSGEQIGDVTQLALYVGAVAVVGSISYSDHFTFVNSTTWYGSRTAGKALFDGNNLYLRIANELATTAAEWETYLASNDITVYYPLRTATDTQITDSTLIAQLEAVLGAGTYNGPTILTSAGEDLPVIMDVTAGSSINEKTYTEVELSDPLTITDVEGKSSITTLNGNVYVDYVYNKKEFTVSIFNLSASDYAEIRGFYDRQFTLHEFPTISIPELGISDMVVYFQIGDREINSQCIKTDKLTLKFRETAQQ